MLLRKQVGAAIGILSLCLFSSGAFAIGLGKLTVNSKLDQPFDGIVELTSATSAELAALQAQFADAEDLARSGIKRMGGSANLEIELVNNGQRAHIRVTSAEAVTDPFMQFVISLTWPKGKVVREYTALIDPLEYGVARVQTSKPTPSQTSTTSTQKTTTAVTTLPSADSSSGEKVIVKRGDTVWSIVSRLRLPAGADEYQMAMALLRSNPAAFPNNNFNSLEAGIVLNVPAADEITRISKSTAAQEFATLSGEKPAVKTVAKQKPVEKVVQKTQAAVTTTQAAASAGGAGTYGPVKEGETLWSIASRLPLAGGADAYQMAVALLQVNPDAFSDGTINSLNSGSVLNVPGVADLARVTDQQVSQAFGTPYSGPKVDTSGGVASTQPVVQVVEKAVTDETSETTQTTIAATGETTQATATQQDESSNQQDENVQALVQRINELEESLAPKEDENLALREKIAMLEEQIEQNDASAQAVAEDLINDAGEEPIASNQTDETAAAASESTSTMVGQESVEDAAMDNMSSSESIQGDSSEAMANQTQGADSAGDDVSNTVSDAVDNTAASVDEAAQAAQNVVSETVEDVNDTTAKVRVTQQASAPWWDRLIPANPIGGIDIKQMGVLAGGVALIGLGTMLFLRRRRSASDESDDDYIPEPAMETPVVTKKAAAAPVVHDDTAIGADSMPSGKIDPVAEAEVYVAYGREHEAEQVLRDALSDNADQPEVELKLLEVYGRSHNTAAFTALAAELKGKWANSQPELWDRVVTQGQDLLPGNALFETGDAESMQFEQADDAVDVVEQFAQPAEPQEVVESKAPSMQVAGSSLELPSKDIGVGNKQIGTTGASSDDEFSIAFDSDGGDSAPQAADVDAQTPSSDTTVSSANVIGADTDMSAALDAIQSGGVNLESATSTVQQAAETDSGADEGNLLEKAMKRAAPVAGGAASAFDDEPSLSDLSATIKSEEQESPNGEHDDTRPASSMDDAHTIDISDLSDAGDDISVSPVTSDEISTEVESTPTTDLSDGLDFDTEDLLDSINEPAASSSDEAATSVSTAQSSSSGSDGSNEPGDPLQWDAIGTKLDLAKAYIDMGDAASASDLIDEAMREGNEQQRSQAAALAAQLPTS